MTLEEYKNMNVGVSEHELYGCVFTHNKMIQSIPKKKEYSFLFWHWDKIIPEQLSLIEICCWKDGKLLGCTRVCNEVLITVERWGKIYEGLIKASKEKLEQNNKEIYK